MKEYLRRRERAKWSIDYRRYESNQLIIGDLAIIGAPLLTTKILAVVPIACAMTKTIPSASELENASELAKQL